MLLQVFRTQSIAQTLTLLDQDGHFSRESSAIKPRAPKDRELEALPSRNLASKSAPVLHPTILESSGDCTSCSLPPPSSPGAVESSEIPATRASESAEQSIIAPTESSQRAAPFEPGSGAAEQLKPSAAVGIPAEPTSTEPETLDSVSGTVLAR